MAAPLIDHDPRFRFPCATCGGVLQEDEACQACARWPRWRMWLLVGLMSVGAWGGILACLWLAWRALW